MHAHGYEWKGYDANGEYVGIDTKGRTVRAVVHEGLDGNFISLLGKSECGLDELTTLSKHDEQTIKDSNVSTDGEYCIECDIYHDYDSEEEGETYDVLKNGIICVDCKHED